MKKKILAVSLVVSLVAVAALGVTLAYFTDTSTVANTFTLGNIDITLEEIVGYDAQEQPIVKTDAYEYPSIVPGDVLHKEPYVKNVGSNDAYVFMKVTLSDAAALDDLLPDLATQNVINFNTTNWNFISNNVDGSNRVIWIGYKTILAPDATTIAPFSTITIPTEWDSDDMESLGEDFSLTVNAYAIQADNIADAAAAYTALQAEITPAP